MNAKIVAIAAVAIIVVAGATTAVILMQQKETASYDAGAFNYVGRVNSEGSGLYINKDVCTGDGVTITRNDTHFFGDNYALSEANKEAWGGLILGDPGSQSIQHTQLATIASKVGLKFKAYTTTTGDPSSDTLYYVTDLNNYDKVSGETHINGGIIWEPQFQKIIQELPSKYKTLALTNDVFPSHTCCVVAMNHNWLADNENVAEKFLAGYVKAVNYINTAKAAGSGADYDNIVSIGVASTTGLNEDEVIAAIANITYKYADDEEGSLADLTTGVATLASDLKDLGIITKSSFKDSTKFSEAFVTDKYMKKAISGDFNKEGTDSIKVLVINGDIHQLAVHVAIAQNYFAEYGLDVTVDKGGNGNVVAEKLINGEYVIGFLGAPPGTIKTIEGEHILIK